MYSNWPVPLHSLSASKHMAVHTDTRGNGFAASGTRYPLPNDITVYFTSFLVLYDHDNHRCFLQLLCFLPVFITEFFYDGFLIQTTRQAVISPDLSSKQSQKNLLAVLRVFAPKRQATPSVPRPQLQCKTHKQPGAHSSATSTHKK